MATASIEKGAFTSALQDAQHAFLQPTLPLYTDALAYLKHALDPLALDVSSAQQQRQQEAWQKRKRGEHLPEDGVLRLKQIHTAGFSVEQVWEQARRVIEAAAAEAERAIEEAATANGDVEDREDGQEEDEVYESSEEDDLGEEGVDYEVEGRDVGVEEDDDDELAFDGQDDYEDLDVDMDAEDMDEDMVAQDGPVEELVADKFGLNDGFFSIDDFNRQSEFLEQQDTRGDDDGAASDEEDIDWDADPVAIAGAANGAPDNEDNDDDEDEGPTFGDPDAPSEDEDEDLEDGAMDSMGGLSNTNSIMYADFFAPPAQKKRKNKKGRPNPHNFPASSGRIAEVGDEGDDIERTMSAVHRDLFEDDNEEEDLEPEEQQPALDPSDPKSRRSAHERRKAALAEEIRRLEAANVAKREWTLAGEARAADRPLNSLLEEALDFERAGKPVPVITAEVSESIEALIKRRILAHDFQDIPRRRPDDLATGSAARRGRLDYELDDNKSRKGLAEEYEEAHLRATDANFVDAKGEKLRKEEKEIEALWKKISADLDGLSSWQFRPKRPAPTLDIRVDAPAISMEDARPSAGEEVAGASMLAPQEVYKAGEGKEAQEVVGSSGLPAGREEMSREERKRRRRREKERGRKAGANQGAEDGGGKREKEKEMVGDLKRGGVKVIGKKGDMRDVEGREVKVGSGGQQSGGRYKL